MNDETGQGLSRKKAAEQALINAAERIFAREGIETASLRAIATAAGSANNYAVQYHFGDREGLVEALFESRLAEVEARRAILRAAMPEPADCRALLDLIMRPLIEQTDAEGRHSYAAFLLGLRRSPQGFLSRRQRSDKAPIANWANEQLAALFPHHSEDAFAFRMDLISAMFLDAIDRFDAGELRAFSRDALLEKLITLAAAMLQPE
ncbi:TetR family transcriptional regulator [Sphingosinithalassobacter portus]|uniref:TetR family transcriptional regulator n=1 Tax=Stakelama portus TaxID=2676234 RepID=UPI000D6DEA7C|nr:TetR family transcriptional regulator [Sphingosinithalassobacter portus]